jgi:hypothetical protein
MLTRSARVVSGTSAVIAATTTPTMIEIRYGVPKRGWTLDSHGGSRWSRLIANSTRLWPSSRVRITVVSPASAPTEMKAKNTRAAPSVIRRPRTSAPATR